MRLPARPVRSTLSGVMTTLRIEGMSCGHCVRAVEQALSTAEGIARVVEVNLERGEAEVEGSVSAERLAQVLDDEGYQLVAVDGAPVAGQGG